VRSRAGFRALTAYSLAAAWLLATPLEGAAQETPPEEEFRAFDADLGQAWIDVSAYPEVQQQAYGLFSRRCSKCHTLARPINSSLPPDQWVAYVNRMSRKPGSGISPKDVLVIQEFLIFDSERRQRSAGAVDPELLPFLGVSRELSGIDRFPASLMDIRPENGSLRVQVEGDRRLDLSRLIVRDDGQKLVRWSRRDPHRGEIIIQEATLPGKPSSDTGEPTESVLAAAQEAVEAESDPTERVELVLDWLDEEFAREYVAGTADADAILADRRGDATEFATVFVAMSRSIGTPARIRVGLVAHRTAFYFHTWAEVWLDGWVPVDPFLGQLPADPTHIRVVFPDDAEIADWSPDTIPGIDRLQFRVVVTEEG
jgi:hypothetical protein